MRPAIAILAVAASVLAAGIPWGRASALHGDPVWGRASALHDPQNQGSTEGPGWPCAGRPDPAYVRTAEATGGQLFLLHPSEVADSGALMAASFSHRDTLFRVAGPLPDGLHEYTVTVDATIESVLFSVSVQCLQVVEIARPSGALLQASEGGVDYHQFEAGRVAIVRRPDPGAWTLRVSGSGVFFLIVQGKAALSLGRVQLVTRSAQPGDESLVPTFDPSRPGARQLVAIALDGAASGVRARAVSATGTDLGPIALRATGDGEWMGEFTVPGVPFRIVLSGTGADGSAFTRVHAPLLAVAGG